jgi:DNA-binding NtrC family response regulator
MWAIQLAAGDLDLPAHDWTLVDDEFDVVTILRQWLERQGFRVFGFTELSLALEHFRLNSKEYRLAISDLRMPEINSEPNNTH